MIGFMLLLFSSRKNKTKRPQKNSIWPVVNVIQTKHSRKGCEVWLAHSPADRNAGIRVEISP